MEERMVAARHGFRNRPIQLSWELLCVALRSVEAFRPVEALLAFRPFRSLTALRTVRPLLSLRSLGALRPLRSLGSLRPVEALRTIGAFVPLAGP
ncbi:MAG: hypothetical protein QUU85_08370, partial [Candidatus Eisenbacteria bacterium]|nr:hypothetical protein [Candidatus Eisenbacteria bacterium]